MTNLTYDELYADHVSKLDFSAMYLDYINNFLTVQAFADHYHIHLSDAQNIIDTKGGKFVLLSDHLADVIQKTDCYKVKMWWYDDKALKYMDRLSYSAFDRLMDYENAPYNFPVVWVPISYSDYGGSTVDVANRKFMLNEIMTDERYSGIIFDCYGSHGTQAIAIDITQEIDIELADQLLELFKGLENYPLFDDDLHSEVEREIEDEDWSNGVARDFHSELCKKFPHLEDQLDEIDADADQFLTLFRQLQERTNTYTEFQDAVSGYYRIETLIDACTVTDAETLITSAYQLTLEIA